MGRAKLAILKALAASGTTMTGLDLVRNSRSLFRGTIYVHLLALEDKGLIHSRQEEYRHGLYRRLYKITDAGRAALEAQEVDNPGNMG